MEEQTVATRVAYVKFMAKTLEKRENQEAKEAEDEEGDEEKKKRTASRKDGEVILFSINLIKSK